MADFFKFRQSINEKKELDPVDDKALDKKFKNRKDKDIDNDGDVDSSDEYLHKRRKAIDKEMEKDSDKKMVADELEKDEDDPCWDGYVQIGTKMKNGKEVPKCVPMEEAKKHMKEEVSKLLGENYDYPDYGPTGAAEMAMTQLHFIQYAAEEVIECLKAGTEMPEWYQNKISKVQGEMEGIHSYMEGKRRKREMCGPEDMGMDDYEYDMDMDDDDDDMMDSQMMSMGMYEAKKMDEKFSVYKSMSPSSGKSVSNKAMVKSFKSKDDMYKFLGKGDNALHWKETGVDGLKSGKYRLNKVRGKDGKPANEFIKESYVTEKLSPTDDISAWIKDFKDSDAPQFKGKSDEERRDMAIAAYYDARKEAGYKTPQQKD